MVTAKPELKNKTEEEARYYISLLDATNPKELGSIVRPHWIMHLMKTLIERERGTVQPVWR